ncbi:MAG: PAS domain S-box protein [Deltaproteobacteria bacterium]|nr:PAS domain S-box protein [Deltaproteobacteria bacterium]
MMPFSLASIRTRLILLVFLILLPTVALIVFNAIEQRRQAVENAMQDAEDTMNFAVLHEEEILGETKVLLEVLASSQWIKRGGKECDRFLARHLKNNPKYLNLGAIRPDGKVYCSGLPLIKPMDLSDRKYFRDALDGRSFSIGNYQVGRITGKRSINFGYPVLDGKGKVTAVVFAALDISRMTQRELEISRRMPPDSTYVKLDSNGAVLAGYPISNLFGRSHPQEKALFEKISKEKKGMFTAKGTDGVERLYLFSSLSGPLFRGEEHILLGISTKRLAAESERLLARNLVVLAVVMLLALGAVWFAGYVLIIRPVDVLTDAAKRLAAGDHSARTGLSPARGEVGQLGVAFDDMAQKLERGQEISRKMLEVAAEKQELGNRLLSLVNNVPGMVYRGHRDWSLSFIGADVEPVTGYTAEEFMDKTVRWKDLIHPDDREWLEESFRAAVKGKRNTLRVEYRIRRKDGVIRWIEDRRQLICDGSGTFSYVDGLLLDITDRKLTEEVLDATRKKAEEEKAKTEAIIAAIGDGIGIQDRDFRILYQNEVLKNLIGEQVGRYCYEAYENLDHLCEGCPVAMAFHDGGVHTMERRVENEKGVMFVEITASPLKDSSGNIVAGIEVVRDITARRKGEESQARLAMAVDQSGEAIVVTDREGTIQYVNPSFERITGYSREDAVGKNPRVLLSGKNDEAFNRELWDTISRGEVWTGHFSNKKKDGSLYEEDVTISPLRDSSGKIVNYVGAMRDVTKLVSLERQVRMAQKMESVGALAGGIAHDFNNVLTVIVGFGEMLKLRIANDPKAVSDLDEILHGAERASVLTRQLLTFARRQVVELGNLDLNRVVGDLEKLLRKLTRENIEVKTHLIEGVPTIRADQGQVEQVLMNLSINARDAMPEGGQLVVETQDAWLDEEHVQKYPYMKAGRYAVLSVSDTGIGMDEQTRDRIFEPFFTTKGPDKGTGLGLAMVYGIVKQHNGFINVYSEPGKGTTFRIYFPAVDDPADSKVVASLGIIRGGSETILLAEDDRSIRNLTEKILSSYGYRVLVACDGEEAIDVFRRHGKEIAMVVLDVVMPKKGGKQAYDEMINTAPGLKALFLSGYSANAIHDSFVLHQGIPFLQKPFTQNALARKVREVLDKA